MQFKIYQGPLGFAVVVLLILALFFFMLPALVVFAVIAGTVSLVASLAKPFLGLKKTQQAIGKKTSGKTIDISAEIE